MAVHAKGPDKDKNTKHKKRASIANLACQNCRRRRIRCSVEEPGQSCNHCIQIGSECVFASEDRRRETVNDLRQRLAQLEKQQEAAAAPAETESSSKKRKLPSPQWETSDTSMQQSQDVPKEEDERSVRLETWDTLTCDDSGTIRAVPLLSANGLSLGITPNPQSKSSPSASLQNILASPSQSTVGGQPLPDLPYNFLAAAANHIADLPIGTDIRVVDHLLHTYFCWLHTAFPIMSLKAFEESFRGQGQYYSPLLLNALLAIASHLSDWPVLSRGSEPGADFFAEAKKLLEDELAQPTICTIQSLCLMSKRELFCGRGLRGGLYFSQAGRLVLDLGLHLDASSLVEKGVLTQMDCYVRSRAYWGIFSLDKEFHALLGRPGTLVDLSTTCPRPPIWHEDDLHWRESVATGMIVPLSATDPERLGALYIGDYNTGISVRHEKLNRLIYRNDGRSISAQTFDELCRSLQELFDQLERCNDEKTDPSRRPSPPWLTARLFSEDQTVIFCRPFLLTDECGPEVQRRAREMCLEAAQNIVDTMDIFAHSKPGGLHASLSGHLHSLLYAAGSFLYEVLLRGPMANAAWKERSHAHLHRVIGLLEGMAPFRPAAGQAIKNLTATINEAESRTASRTNSGSKIPTIASQEPEQTELDRLLAWPQDGLDAFLFSSQQYPGHDTSTNVNEMPSGNTWFSTAMLFQSQGQWANYLR